MGYFCLSQDHWVLRIFCNPDIIQIRIYHDVRKLFRSKLLEFYSQLSFDAHIPQDGTVLVIYQSTVVASHGAMHANLIGHQIDTLRRTGRTKDHGDLPSVNVLQMIQGAGHDTVPGVQ